jgi:hypothetical protein
MKAKRLARIQLRSERLTTNRFQLHLPVKYQTPVNQGTGITRDISLHDAQIEQVSCRLRPGSKMILKVAFVPTAPLELPAEVVRETQTGFAVRFVDLDAELQDLMKAFLSNLAAIAAKG